MFISLKVITVKKETIFEELSQELCSLSSTETDHDTPPPRGLVADGHHDKSYDDYNEKSLKI